MTDRIYYTEPSCREFEATVTRVGERDGRSVVTLDRTAFYPTSGGQPFDIGRLGPVDDSGAMASNILSVWNADRGKMSEIAQAEARQYSWDRSMDALFGQLYRTAFNARSQRLIETPVRVREVLAGVPAE